MKKLLLFQNDKKEEEITKLSPSSCSSWADLALVLFSPNQPRDSNETLNLPLDASYLAGLYSCIG